MDELRLAVTVEEAARAIGIGRSKAYQLCATGEWPTIRVGRAVRVPLEGLKQWLADQAEASGRR